MKHFQRAIAIATVILAGLFNYLLYESNERLDIVYQKIESLQGLHEGQVRINGDRNTRILNIEQKLFEKEIENARVRIMEALVNVRYRDVLFDGIEYNEEGNAEFVSIYIFGDRESEYGGNTYYVNIRNGIISRSIIK